jgi:hypothetical protein
MVIFCGASDADDEAQNLRSSRRQMRQKPLDVDMTLNMMGDAPAQAVVQIVADCTVPAGWGWAEAEMTGSMSEDLVFVRVRRSSAEEELVRMVDSTALPCVRSGTEAEEIAAAASEGSNSVDMEDRRSQGVKTLSEAVAVVRDK